MKKFGQFLGMVKNISILFVLCCAATAVCAEEQNKQYRPEVVYAGEFIPTALYYRHNTRQPWMHVSKLETYQDRVSGCAEAKQKLSTDGKWVGNLNLNGSCGTTAEPAVYMIGNRLNYDAIMKGY